VNVAVRKEAPDSSTQEVVFEDLNIEQFYGEQFVQPVGLLLESRETKAPSGKGTASDPPVD